MEEWRRRMWEQKCLDLSAITPVPTAIFYFNDQIRQEASEVFYKFNRFTFESSARAALYFLEDLPAGCRRLIKDLGFTGQSMNANDHNCTYSWESLWDFINSQMSVNSVTIQVPRHRWLKIDETKPAKETPNTGRYRWSAPRLLIAALMDGKIQQLRLACLATLRLRNSVHSKHKDPVENLEAISCLSYPQPQEELRREALEGKALRSAIAKGQPHEFDSMAALVADQETRRQRFNFVVTREDDPVGDLGTVLVLTRPTKS